MSSENDPLVSSQPAGWYPDPQNPAGKYLYWDGSQWKPGASLAKRILLPLLIVATGILSVALIFIMAKALDTKPPRSDSAYSDVPAFGESYKTLTTDSEAVKKLLVEKGYVVGWEEWQIEAFRECTVEGFEKRVDQAGWIAPGIKESELPVALNDVDSLLRARGYERSGSGSNRWESPAGSIIFKSVEKAVLTWDIAGCPARSR